MGGETYTRQELIDYLWNIRKEKGRDPVKADLPYGMAQYFRKEFGKWCYALEEAGIRIPSQKTLDRREHRKRRWRRKHNKSSNNSALKKAK